MNNKDFMTCFWGFPLFGALLGFVLAVMFHTAEVGILVMLGIVAGYLALHTYVIGIKFTIHEEKKEDQSL